MLFFWRDLYTRHFSSLEFFLKTYEDIPALQHASRNSRLYRVLSTSHISYKSCQQTFQENVKCKTFFLKDLDNFFIHIKLHNNNSLKLSKNKII